MRAYFKIGRGETKHTESPGSSALRKQHVASPYQDWPIKLGQVMKSLNTPDCSAVKQSQEYTATSAAEMKWLMCRKHAVYIMYAI